MASTPVSRAHKAAAAGASTGFLAGLVTIFLPLLQATPGHLAPGTVQTAVGAGVALCLGSVGGWLVHHGILTKAEMTTGITDIQGRLPAIETYLAHEVGARPQLMADIAKAKADGALAVAKVTDLEAKLPGSAQVVDDFDVKVVNALSDLLGDSQLITSAGAMKVPKVAISVPPAAPDGAVVVSP